MANREEVYSRFGRMLARCRERAGLTQEKLAGLVGLSRTSVANIERGRQPVQLHTLYVVADALGVEIPDLLPAVPKPNSGLPIESRQVDQLNIKEEQFLRKIASPATKLKRR